MQESEVLATLIGDIYDAILDKSLWNEVLGKAAQFVGAQAGALLWRNAPSRCVDVVHACGIESPYLQMYKEQYAKLDPTMPPMLHREVGEVASTTDLVSYSEFLVSPFYKEWVQPQGLVDLVQANLDKSAKGIVHLCFLRNCASGMADDATRDRMRLIVPHMRNVALPVARS